MTERSEAFLQPEVRNRAQNSVSISGLTNEV